MLVGVPGSGKSHWANDHDTDIDYLTYEDDYAHVLSTDDIISDIADLLDKTYTQIFDTAIGASQSAVNALITLKSISLRDIILDQTNLTVKSRMGKLDLLRNKEEYRKIAIYFDTPLEIIKDRLNQRNATGKIIGDKLLHRMLDSFEMPTLEEGFDEVRTVGYQYDA